MNRVLLTTAFVFSVACGGATTNASSTSPAPADIAPSSDSPPSSAGSPASSAGASVLAIGPVSFSLLSEVELAADGRVQIDGRDAGTLHADGRFVAPDGTVVATLRADGAVVIDGVERFRLLDDALMENGHVAFELRNGAIVLESDSVPVTGYRPELGRAVLVLSGVVLMAYAGAYAH